jgi:predicted restriction endonuclease
MSRKGDFSKKTKRATIQRQCGVCAFCGVALKTPWSNGDFQGYAHHLRPLLHGGSDGINNCVYLCWGHHQLIGHGMAPFGIDNQGGSSSSWVQLSKDDFEYWDGLSDEMRRKHNA